MTAAEQRPLGDVPGWIWALLVGLLAAQVACHAWRERPALAGSDLPPPPSATALRLASFGEAAAAARLELLYLQAFDLGGGNELPYRKLDYGRLIGWLRAALELDPRSDYPLFLAARVYTEIPDPARIRRLLEFVEAAFRADPDHRWQWLAHAALLAKHRLHDLPLARRYAAEIDRLATSPEVPGWARQMEVFILEDMDELEAARVLLGGLLASGKIRDEGEARYLRHRLEELEARIAARKVK
jgi:hypothetical protein